MADLEAPKPVKMRAQRPRSYYDDRYYDVECEEDYRRSVRRPRPHSQHGRPPSKHITMNNFNEETYKIVNHLHRTMSQQREQSFTNSLPRRKCEQEPLYEKGNPNYTSSSLGDNDTSSWGKYPDDSGISNLPSPGRSVPSGKKPVKKKGRYASVLSSYGEHLKQKAENNTHAALVKTASALPSKKLSGSLVAAIKEGREKKEISKRASSSPKTVLPTPPPAGTSSHIVEPSAPISTTADTFDTAYMDSFSQNDDTFDYEAR